MIDLLSTPFRIKAMLVSIAVAGAAALGLWSWGLYWRGEYRAAVATVATLQSQSAVLAEATRACSASVAAAQAAGAAAVLATHGMLVEARRLQSGGRSTVAKIEDMIKNSPRGAGCEEAWGQIELLEQKAGR